MGSSLVPGERTEHYADILNCVPECRVVAAGFPFPYIADYPGLSPTHSADLWGALMGLDKFRLDAFCIDAIVYFILCEATYRLWKNCNR
jgi:hypothetical protein